MAGEELQGQASAGGRQADAVQDKPDRAETPREKSAAASEPKASAPAPYTAVIYVHGIGSQRRYEETSRLIDRLDHYLNRQHKKGNSLGMLGKIEPRVEPLGPTTDVGPNAEVGPEQRKDIIAYIRTIFTTGPRGEGAQAVRFYEIYWAPFMAQTESAWGVIKWVFAQPLRPWATVRAPWRERQRLRRASLVALFDRGKRRPTGTEDRDYASLRELYNDFEGPAALRDYPAGTFKDFLTFIAKSSERKPDTAKRRLLLAHAWRVAYVRTELASAFALTTMALALLLLAGGVIASVLQLLHAVTGYEPLAALFESADAPLKADWKTAIAVVLSLGGLLGLGKLVTDYLGDVQAWATYEETDVKNAARQKVLESSLDVLTHVLCSEACARVVIVAHSLGTSVAHDALLALTRRNRAFRPQDPMSGPVPLHKIEHFITMGSPIDKIEYFFESYASDFHRYKRVVEALRGDIGSPPFSHNRKPHIHWINFWDEGDLISGALYSPAGAEGVSQHVDNYHVASFRFPSPGASHSGYFNNELVVQKLFEAIYHRAGSFETLTQPAPNRPYDYDSVLLGPGEPVGGRRTYLALILATPWLVLAGLIGWLLGGQHFAFGAWGLAAAAITVLLAGYVASRAEGPLKPI